MAFLGGNTSQLKVTLTPLGLKVLAEKGLENEIRYYNLFDEGVNYQVNVFPNLLTDVCGTKNVTLINGINFNTTLASNASTPRIKIV